MRTRTECNTIQRQIGPVLASLAGLLLTVSPAHAQVTITTVAGNGFGGFSGDGGLATSAALNLPQGVKIDGAGNLYIADFGNFRVRKVSAGGIMSTLAGTGQSGNGGDGGLAANASLNDVTDVAIDSAGNVYISDAGNHRVRKVTPGGMISAFAGTGVQGYSGDGGQAASAQLNRPIGLVIDANNYLYISDSSSQNIRRVNLNSGVISTYAGNGTAAFSGDGGQAISASLMFPLGLAADGAGNLYIADAGNNAIRKVTPTGIITTIAGSGVQAGFSGDGGPAARALLNVASGVGVDGAGNVFIGDSGNNRVRRIDAATGIISTIAGSANNGYSGDGGPAASALLNFPWGISVDPSGAIYVADRDNNRIRKISGSATLTDVAAGKIATQSSTLFGYPSAVASSAVDGRTDGNFFDGSVTATNQESTPWWQVDLASSTVISSINIWNRTDCCSSRLSDYWVFVSDTPFNASDTPSTLQFRAGTVSSHQTSAPSPSTNIAMSAQGRYVRVQLSTFDYLSLAEVQVFGTPASGGGGGNNGTNIAPGKLATQSSSYPGLPTAGPSSAIDNNTDGNFYDGSVTATSLDNNPWWQVDLGSAATVNSVVVWNRTDCCSLRLSDYWVFVSNTPFSASDTPATLQFRAGTFSSHQTFAPSPSATINVGMQGRYVRVQLSDTDYLSLAEVQVFGTGGSSPTDLAINKVTSQSSNLPFAPTALSGSAADGNSDGNFYDGSVTATNPDTNAWWQVDLGSPFSVSQVIVWNRTDCCSTRLSDFWVFVSDNPFQATDTPATLQFRGGTFAMHITSAPNPSVTIPVNLQGRYVRVQLSGTDYLSLAEVQVIGQ
ncbi:MAG TPA: discoidin domain-containing protein [Bryobacteraceae bacterium]|nr:discoidin domain-containing protein [Bryobacteraceae bacterium]